MKHIKLFTHILFSVSVFVLSSCSEVLIGDEGRLDEDIYLNYQTSTALELPFEDEWYVINGGKTHREGAHHFINRGGGERYAIDFLMVLDTVLPDGTVRKINYAVDFKQNENHYCFGKRLNAPGDGKIIAVVNTVDDNQPGTVNRNQPGGNYLTIDHLNGETSILAHLKKGSIIVAIGENVVKGQEVGQAGNSGASDAPHVHYQLQGTAGVLEGLGLPTQFLNYFEGDALVERGEPVKGQEVRKN